MKKGDRLLLLRLRTALKEAGLVINANNVRISDSKTGKYVKFARVITDSDYTDLELFANEYIETPIARAWRTTNKDRCIEE